MFKQLTTAEEEWQKRKEVSLSQPENTAPLQKRKEDKTWMDPKVLSLMVGKRTAKGQMEKYEVTNGQVKKLCSKAKENWIANRCYIYIFV